LWQTSDCLHLHKESRVQQLGNNSGPGRSMPTEDGDPGSVECLRERGVLQVNGAGNHVAEGGAIRGQDSAKPLQGTPSLSLDVTFTHHGSPVVKRNLTRYVDGVPSTGGRRIWRFRGCDAVNVNRPTGAMNRSHGSLSRNRARISEMCQRGTATKGRRWRSELSCSSCRSGGTPWCVLRSGCRSPRTEALVR